MKTNNLAKPFSIQLFQDQNRALEMLKDKGFNKNILIRLALDKMLYEQFRPILKELRSLEEKKSLPEFVK